MVMSNQASASLVGLQEYIEHPFGKGDLTASGAQYAAETTIATTAMTEVPAQQTIKLPPNQKVVEVEFGLTGGLYNSNSTTTAQYNWQGSDAGSAWTNLMTTALTTAVTATTDYTISGRFLPAGNFLATGSSFLIRMVAAQSTGAGNVLAKVKNSSYVKVITKSW